MSRQNGDGLKAREAPAPKTCSAPLEPPCHKATYQSNLCEAHWRDGWPGCGWQRIWVESVFEVGRKIYYLAPDTISKPFLIDPGCIIRVVGPHKPCGGKCPCCMDQYTTQTSMWVEHTTWGEPCISSVCWECATNCPGNPRYHLERLQRRTASVVPKPESKPVDNGYAF